MNEQLNHYQRRLDFEIDSWDLKVSLDAKEDVVVVDARSPKALATDHIPGASFASICFRMTDQ